jgi:hypothetical protein
MCKISSLLAILSELTETAARNSSTDRLLWPHNIHVKDFFAIVRLKGASLEIRS